MTTLKDLYTGGIAPGISQGMQWAGQAQAIQGAKTRNDLVDLALQNEPTRLSNENRLADLVAQGKEQAINQNAQAQGVTNLDLLRRALEGFGPIAEIKDDETANQRYQLARTVLSNAGVDLTGMPETTTAQELQAVGGMNGAAGNNGVQSTFTTNDGKLGYVTRDGRTVVTDQKVQRSYQVRDYGDQPFVFDSKTGAIMPVRGAVGDAAADAAARERQAKVEQERQIAQAKEFAKGEAEKRISEQGQMGTLQQAMGAYDRLSDSDLGMIYGKGEAWYPDFFRSQKGIDMIADRDQLVGMLEMAGRGQLKGQGTVSDNDQKTLQRAMTVLSNPNISPEAARRALDEAMAVISRSAGQEFSPAGGQEEGGDGVESLLEKYR